MRTYIRTHHTQALDSNSGKINTTKQAPTQSATHTAHAVTTVTATHAAHVTPKHTVKAERQAQEGPQRFARG